MRKLNSDDEQASQHLRIATHADLTISGSIDDYTCEEGYRGLPVVKYGTARVVYAAANYYTGSTTVKEGTLVLAHAEALPAANVVTLAGGGCLKRMVSHRRSGR